MINKRQERRINLSNIALRIRKKGFTSQHWDNGCKVVDISQNGLAFTSSDLELKTLQKVNIELGLESKIISGEAIVCYASNDSGLSKYGVMFIQTTPELEQIFSAHLLSKHEVVDMAEKMAEQFMLEKTRSPEKQKTLQQTQLMFDAVAALVRRLSDMGLAVSNGSDKSLQPSKVLKFEPANRSFEFPRLMHSSGKIETETVSLKLNNDSSIYQTSREEVFENIFELLDFLCSELGKLEKSE